MICVLGLALTVRQNHALKTRRSRNAELSQLYNEPVRRVSPNRFVVAVGATLVALLFRLVLQPFLGADIPLLFFVPAVLVSGWYGGLGPALFATVLSTAAARLFILAPEF